MVVAAEANGRVKVYLHKERDNQVLLLKTAVLLNNILVVRCINERNRILSKVLCWHI